VPSETLPAQQIDRSWARAHLHDVPSCARYSASIAVAVFLRRHVSWLHVVVAREVLRLRICCDQWMASRLVSTRWMDLYRKNYIHATPESVGINSVSIRSDGCVGDTSLPSSAALRFTSPQQDSYHLTTVHGVSIPKFIPIALRPKHRNPSKAVQTKQKERAYLPKPRQPSPLRLTL
jgi:hypothetical protein